MFMVCYSKNTPWISLWNIFRSGDCHWRVNYCSSTVYTVIFKVNKLNASETNNTETLEVAIESIRTATVANSSSVDLNATTDTLSLLAQRRAGIQNAFVSEGEVLVSLSFHISSFLSFLPSFLSFYLPLFLLSFLSFPFLTSFCYLSFSLSTFFLSFILLYFFLPSLFLLFLPSFLCSFLARFSFFNSFFVSVFCPFFSSCPPSVLLRTSFLLFFISFFLSCVLGFLLLGSFSRLFLENDLIENDQLAWLPASAFFLSSFLGSHFTNHFACCSSKKHYLCLSQGWCMWDKGFLFEQQNRVVLEMSFI